MKKKIISLLLFGALLLSLLSGCSGGTAAPTGQRTVTDLLGRTVTIPDSPQQICALNPFCAPFVVSFGHGDKMKATVNAIKRDLLIQSICPSLKDAVVVKNGGVINAEALLELGVDLIFLEESTYADEDERAKLDALSIPYIVLCNNNIQQAMDSILLMGEVLDAQERAQAYVQYYRDTLDLVSRTASAIPPEERPTLYHSVNLPQITICETYGGAVVAAPTYVSGSSDGIELVIPANTLTDGSYVLVFGKDIQANKAEKTLGQDIVFQFTVSADADVPSEPADPKEPSAAPDCPYTDVSPSCAAAVMAMVEKGYLTPDSDTLLNAAQPVTRGEFVSLLGRCRNINSGKYTASSYTDVENTDPAMPYIEWAAAKGVVVGYGNGRFGASNLLTREQAACILYSYAIVFDADNKDASASIGSFADGKQVSGWAKNAVKWAVAAGALTADDANQLNPGAPVSREEMAALVYAAAGVK